MTDPNIYVHYDKINKCIESCKNLSHITNADNMIDTFEKVFKNHVNCDSLWKSLNIHSLVKMGEIT